MPDKNQVVTEPDTIEKVDTTPANDQEAAAQAAVMAVMSGQTPTNPLLPDSTAGQAAPVNAPETPAPAITEQPLKTETEPLSGDAAEQLGEEVTVYTETELNAKLAEKDAEIERIKALHNEQKGENIRLVSQNRNNNQMAPYGEVASDGDQAVAFQTDSIYLAHFAENKDIYSDKDIADFKAYRQSGDLKILQANPTMASLDSKLFFLKPGNEKAPLADLAVRLNDAFTLAFKDRIIDNHSKQALAQAEIANQKKTQTVSAPAGAGLPAKTSRYTPEQHRVAVGMGAKLEE